MTKEALIAALEKVRLEIDADLLLLKSLDDGQIRAFIDDDKIRAAYDAIYRRYA